MAENSALGTGRETRLNGLLARRLAACALFLAAAPACATVKVEAPDEPIEINLNVNIQQEVRFKIEREIEDLIAENPDIF